MTDYWLAIRTAGSRTLACASALAKAGFNAWTPIEVKVGKAKSTDEVKAPIIASFVFVEYDRMPEVMAMAHEEALRISRVWDDEQGRVVTNIIPKFSVMRENDDYPRPIPEAALVNLRAAENKRKPRGSVKLYNVGDRVKLLDGAFSGLSGIVQRVHGKKAEVSFPDAPGFVRTITLPMWVLLDDMPVVNIQGGQGEQALKAKAA